MRYFPSILVAGVLMGVVSFASAGAIVVKVSRVDDNRLAIAPGAARPVFNPNPPGLTVTLHVSGAVVRSAVSYGKVMLTECRDNLGDKLRIVSSSPPGFPAPSGANAMIPIQRQPAGFGPASTGFDVPLQLTEVPRKATRITVLNGSFLVVAGGKLNTISIKPMKLLGKAVQSPVLDKAGLHIAVLKSMPAGMFDPGTGPSLLLKISGKTQALRKVRILNAAGANLFNGFIGSIMQNGAKFASYQIKRPLKAGDKVMLNVMVGQREIKVPFGFQNIKLP